MSNSSHFMKRCASKIVVKGMKLVEDDARCDANVVEIILGDNPNASSSIYQSAKIDAKVYLPDAGQFTKSPVEKRCVKTYLARILKFPVLSCGCCHNLFAVGKCVMRDVGKFPNEVLKRVFPDLTFDHILNEREFLCGTCWKYLKINELPSCCFLNKLQLDSSSCRELLSLNSLEKAMVARYRVCLRIFTLPSGGQKASRGFCIQLPSDVESLFSKLPISLKTAGQLFVRNGIFSANVFKINGLKLRKALDYLIRHHSEYKNIFLDLELLDQLDNVGDGLDLEPVFDEFHGVADPEREVRGVNSTFILPELEKVVITNKIDKWEACGFPYHYPLGRNDFSEKNREVRITLGAFIKNRVNHVDGRFRDDSTWVLAMANYLDQQHARSAIGIAGKFARQDFKKKDLQTKMDGVKSFNGYAFVQPIRCSFAFWQKHFGELMARFAMLGPPVFFVTLSANDIGWPDVICAIWKDSSPEAILRAKSLPYEERVSLIRKNPVLVCQQMDNRFRSIIDFIINPKGAKPLGEVSDYFARVEFQNRGSPHLHLFVWVKDFPPIEKLSETVAGREQLCSLIDKFISCSIPEKKDDPVLHALVVSLQKHVCTFTCKSKGGWCRFTYPMLPSSVTMIHDIVLARKKKFYLLKRSVEEVRINAYNPLVLRVWGGNMDIQMVIFV